MPVRFNSGGYLQRFTSGSTQGIPQAPACAIGGRFRRVNNRGSACLFLLRGEATTGYYIGAYVDAVANSFTIESTWGRATVGMTVTTGYLYAVGLSINGTTATIAAGNAVSLSSPAAATLTIGASPNFDMIRVGNDGYGAWLDGECDGLVTASAALGTRDLHGRLCNGRPTNQTDLMGWYPMLWDGRYPFDFGGREYDLSIVGTPTEGAQNTEGVRRVAWSNG